MSRLQLFGRPFVVFDPKNKDHRNYYHTFATTHSWGQCPVRFVIDDDNGDLVTMIQRKLIEYYTNKEFGLLVVKEQQKIRPKSKSKG